MQAIQTKYIPATNYKPSRVKAWCERGSIVARYDSGSDDYEAHRAAAEALRHRFAVEDRRNYGTPIEINPWMRPIFGGGLPVGGYAFVFVS